MRGRNSSKYYRRNSYKKRKWRNILIISAVCLAALFLLFVILGNFLDKKIELERAGRDNAHTTAVPIDDTVAYTIEAYPIELAQDIDFTDRMQAFSTAGIRAVSLKVTDGQGKLLVSSALATSMGYQSKSDSLVDISAVISKAKYYSMHSSAVLDLRFVSEADAKQRAVLLAYESALSVEIAEQGADEVIVRVVDANAAHTDLLIDFAESVSAINDNVVLGVALPWEFFLSDASAENVAKLAESFDILGIDTSNVPSDTDDTLAYIESVFSESNLKYYVLRYNMRVILPQISDEADGDLRTVLAENSIQNWQKIS